MKMRRIVLVFIFLLLIPYICSLAIIGIGYNALVLHSSDPFRTAIGALVGAIIMMAVKATIQRPLNLLAGDIYDSFLKQLLRFFSIRRRPILQAANVVLDFFLCTLATIIVRHVLPLNIIVGTSTGFVLLIMFISTCLGAYIEYDNLSIDSEANQE
ncbi:MAG: hypothetical protein SOH68_04990 [Lactobacillus sp.]|jgi:hypothetical protein